MHVRLTERAHAPKNYGRVPLATGRVSLLWITLAGLEGDAVAYHAFGICV